MARNVQPHNSLLLIWFHHATVTGFVGKHDTRPFAIGGCRKTAFTSLHSSSDSESHYWCLDGSIVELTWQTLSSSKSLLCTEFRNHCVVPLNFSGLGWMLMIYLCVCFCMTLKSHTLELTQRKLKKKLSWLYRGDGLKQQISNIMNIISCYSHDRRETAVCVKDGVLAPRWKFKRC